MAMQAAKIFIGVNFATKIENAGSFQIVSPYRDFLTAMITVFGVKHFN
jgi:hypothetical protein